MTDWIYCRHCDEQVRSCLAAAQDAQKSWIRSYFLTLAGKWTRVARDLEDQRACGAECPLREACGREGRIAAEPTLPTVAVA
jgi:hypothetical protein